jgi:acyl-CoA thioester hydrolase
MSEEYRCWYPLQIRFRDLDPLAHVNNSVYFIYFEEARSHYFSQLTPWLKQWPAGKEHQQPDEEEATAINDRESETPNPRIRTDPRGRHYGILVKEATCTYELPLVRSDKTEVGIRVTNIGRSSIIIEHEIRTIDDHTRIFARGRVVMVWSNYYTGRPHPVPQSLRNAFEQMEQRTF